MLRGGGMFGLWGRRIGVFAGARAGAFHQKFQYLQKDAIIGAGQNFITAHMAHIYTLRAAGDAKFPVYMAMISMWGIGLPLAYLFGIHFGLGLMGIWISFIADEWVRGILMYRRWRSRIWIQKGIA